MMRRFGLLIVMLLVGLNSGTVAAQGVRAVVTSEVANVRILPNFGGTPLGQVPAGFSYHPNARDAASQWLRFDFNGSEGWIHISTSAVVEGDLGALPVADPRSIPYGGFEAPRAGRTSNFEGPTTTARDWLRIRAGPSTAYPTIGSIPINGGVIMMGRTAASNWIQINFEGTLGWVSGQFLNYPPGFEIASLPVDGIIAEAPPLGDDGRDFLAQLLFMRDRLDLAEPSLNIIRTYWTDSALTGRASCQPFPPRPSDIQIPVPLLAAYFESLEPLRVRFNDAMFNIRLAIDLFIEACEQPGTVNPVGQATVQGALETVNLAERQIIDLRNRIDELLPEPFVPGENDCVFSFAGAVDILRVVPVGELIRDVLNPRRFAVGYCFDATAEQALAFEVLQRLDSNAILLLTVSPVDDPTDFIAVGRASGGGNLLRVGPLIIPRTGRYLITVSSIELLEGPFLQSEFGVYIAFPEAPSLELDPVTGEVVAPFFFVPDPSVPPIVIPPVGGVPGAPQPPPGGPIIIPPAGGASNPAPGTNVLPGVGTGAGICPSITATCAQLTTCEQATACLQLGNFSLDPEGNGIPCENTLCPGFGTP